MFWWIMEVGAPGARSSSTMPPLPPPGIRELVPERGRMSWSRRKGSSSWAELREKDKEKRRRVGGGEKEDGNGSVE